MVADYGTSCDPAEHYRISYSISAQTVAAVNASDDFTASVKPLNGDSRVAENTSTLVDLQAANPGC